MLTQVLDANRDEDVRAAGLLLREGQLVAFPTETVYGLGARADDDAALQALLRIKERPPDKKFTILIARPGDWRLHASLLNGTASALVEAFWPGPLTLVVPQSRGGEVGLRCPDCLPARRMLAAARVPVVAPSANITGRPPANSASDVLTVFEGRIAAVLDGGPARLGRPSTVVRVRRGQVEMVRVGAISEERIRAALDLERQK